MRYRHNQLTTYWPLAAAVALALGACSTSSGNKTASGKAAVQGGYKIGVPYQIEGKWYYPKENFEYEQVGVASWYGHPFHGKTAASGERYDMWAMTAAHKTLPMPSLVEVTNLENGRTARLRVNDRGPFVDGRIIDVSRAAARELGFEMNGTAKVRVRILRTESEELKQIAMGNQPSSSRSVQLAGNPGPAATPPSTLQPVVQQSPSPVPAATQPVTTQPIRAAGPGGAGQGTPLVLGPSAKPAASSYPAQQAQAPARTQVRRSIVGEELPPVGGAKSAPPASSTSPRPSSGGAVTTPPKSGSWPPERRTVIERDGNPQPGAPSVTTSRRTIYPQRPLASRPGIRLERTPTPPPVASTPAGKGRIYVQAGAFRSHGNALRLRDRLSRIGKVRIDQLDRGGQPLYRVRVGPVATHNEGARLLTQVVEAGQRDARIVKD